MNNEIIILLKFIIAKINNYYVNEFEESVRQNPKIFKRNSKISKKSLLLVFLIKFQFKYNTIFETKHSKTDRFSKYLYITFSSLLCLQEIKLENQSEIRNIITELNASLGVVLLLELISAYCNFLHNNMVFNLLFNQEFVYIYLYAFIC